jgi:hypothetical protein
MGSSSGQDEPPWLDDAFWERLDRLESRHQRIQSQHESLRRNLEEASRRASTELAEVWKRYCEVIAELDRTSAEFETLRADAC